MQLPRPTKARVFVFSVPLRRKAKGSFLYQPAVRRGSISGAQECWIITSGPDVKDPLPIGQKAYVSDGFSFEEVKMDYLWDTLQDRAEFAALRKLVDEVEGDVAVQMVQFSDIMAVED